MHISTSEKERTYTIKNNQTKFDIAGLIRFLFCKTYSFSDPINLFKKTPLLVLN